MSWREVAQQTFSYFCYGFTGSAIGQLAFRDDVQLLDSIGIAGALAFGRFLGALNVTNEKAIQNG